MVDSRVGLITPPEGVGDSGFRSLPSQSTSPTPTPPYPSYQTHGSLSGSFITPDLNSSPPEHLHVNTIGIQAMPSSHGTHHHTISTDTSSIPSHQQRLANHDGPYLNHQPSPANGYQPGAAGSPVLPRHGMISQATQISPVLNRQMPISQGTQSSPIQNRQGPFQSGYQPSLAQPMIQPNQSSPVMSRQMPVSQGTQSSPTLNRQGLQSPSTGYQPSLTQSVIQPTQISPVLSRQTSLTHPGQSSPILGRHPSVTQMSHGSPSLDRHPMHSGYTTPDERHGALSRQSSSSGYHPPSTPSFPVSPASYSDNFRQPQLPEKRRMSNGERPNGVLSYSTLNGKMSSPMSSGGSTPSVHFFHTLPDFSKLNMCGKAFKNIYHQFLGWIFLPNLSSLIFCISCFVDGSPETRLNVKFVQDTSKFWYKPDISREQGKVLVRVLVDVSVFILV